MAVIRTNQLIRKELESERFKGIGFIDHSNLDKNEFRYDSKHFRINSGVKILATNIKKNTTSPLPPPHVPPTGPYYRSLIPGLIPPVVVPPGQPTHW